MSTGLVMLVLLISACGRPFSDAPVLSGSTCEELARSYGTELQKRQLAIIDAAEYPEDRLDPAYDQEAYEVATALREGSLGTARALMPLYGPDSFPDCPPDKFLSLAERELGNRFRQAVPPATASGGDKPDWTYYRELIRDEVDMAWLN